MHALAEAGRVVGGRYRLRESIGRGAMGTVWRARDELLDRDVAVKEMKIPLSFSEKDRRELYERTFREAKTAARLSHPGVVTVFDVVEEDRRPWIVMELVQARSLDRVLAEDGPLPPQRAADVGQQLVGALATAHAAGVLHRDVKPSNVLLAPDGRAVLTDFGIAMFEGDAGLTQTGMVMGTPAFTPPERIRGEPATPSSDLWSLGATLYAAVQGRGPYQERGGAITTMNAVINEDAPAAPSAGRLGPVIAALLHRDPTARPSAATAAMLLSGAVSGPDAGVLGAAGAGVGDCGAAGPAYPASGAGMPYAGSGVGAAGAAYPPLGEPVVPYPRSGESAPRQLGFGDPTPQYASFGESARPQQSAGGTLFDIPLGAAPPYPPYGQAGSGSGADGGTRVNEALPPFGGNPRHAGYPDPAGQGKGSRRVAIMACVAAVIVGAGIVGGFAVRAARIARVTNTSQSTGTKGHPAASSSTAAGRTSAAPAGYSWYAQSAASTGTAAGFRLAVPQGWSETRDGLTTYLRAPAGAGFMEVDLTQQSIANTMAEARWVEVQARRQGRFPGYRRISLRPVQMLGTSGAVWSFSWQEAGVGRVVAQDYFFDLNTTGGTQSYALYGSAPLSSWSAGAQILSEALNTFQPVS
ncbi:MAG TPA: serine/threonine-protein kinase [Streptosporangiaceae bacterium]|jgi:tRNA A-37 threonylcarbamoyl transferase component Bud32